MGLFRRKNKKKTKVEEPSTKEEEPTLQLQLTDTFEGVEAEPPENAPQPEKVEASETASAQETNTENKIAEKSEKIGNTVQEEPDGATTDVSEDEASETANESDSATDSDAIGKDAKQLPNPLKQSFLKAFAFLEGFEIINPCSCTNPSKEDGTIDIDKAKPQTLLDKMFDYLDGYDIQKALECGEFGSFGYDSCGYESCGGYLSSGTESETETSVSKDNPIDTGSSLEDEKADEIKNSTPATPLENAIENPAEMAPVAVAVC